MNIYLKNQQPDFKSILERLKTKNIMAYDSNRLVEKISTTYLDTPFSIEKINLDFLFDYHIFPENIMSFLSEWHTENRTMQPGDTILQQVYLPPIKRLSQKIIFGVRIKEIIDLPLKKGFSYQTLDGHVEKGISSFTVEQNKDQQLIFKIHTFSRPATLLTRILGPIFSIPYQHYCTNAALKNVKRQIALQ